MMAHELVTDPSKPVCSVHIVLMITAGPGPISCRMGQHFMGTIFFGYPIFAATEDLAEVPRGAPRTEVLSSCPAAKFPHGF